MKNIFSLVLLLFSSNYILTSFGFFGSNNQRHQVDKVEEIDLYDVLGVDEDATDKEIKSAYRTRSMECHPDRTGGDESASEVFRSISYAYNILSNQENRFLYDQGGIALIKEAEEREQRGNGQNYFEGVFGSFFDGANMQNNGNDKKMQIHVTLENVYNGFETFLTINRRVVCKGCDKSSSKQNKKTEKRCSKCTRCPNEVQTVQRNMGGFIIQEQEQVRSKHYCKNEDKELRVLIERGIAEGTEVKFKYMSEQTPGNIPGDVVVVITQKKHPRFERDGDHLKIKMKVTLKEALTGFTKRFEHLDGHEVTVDRERKVTRPFQEIVLKGKGMPVHDTPSQSGDLRVVFEVEFPKTLTLDQITQIQQVL